MNGEHVVINGRKMWITNASICDVINVTATLGKASDGANRMIRVVVDREESPFETSQDRRRSASRRVIWARCCSTTAGCPSATSWARRATRRAC